MEMTVNKSMSIGEVLNIHRGTARILTAFGMHCLGCPASRAESLADACAVHGIPAERVIEAINAKIAEAR